MRRALVVVFAAMAMALAQRSAIAIDKVICIARAERPPVIDGELNDPCWDRGEFISDFVHVRTHVEPADKTEVGMVYDNDYLYVAVVCHGRMSEAYLKSDKVTPPDRYSDKYTFEIGIDPSNLGMNHYQFVFGPKGEKADFSDAVRLRGKSLRKDAWNGQWDFRCKRGERSRAFEVRIRWDSFVKDASVRAGRAMGLEMARNNMLTDALWAPPENLFHDGRHWGVMVLGGYESWWREHVLAQCHEMTRFVTDGKVRDEVLTRELSGFRTLAPPADRVAFQRRYRRWSRIRNRYVGLRELTLLRPALAR